MRRLYEDKGAAPYSQGGGEGGGGGAGGERERDSGGERVLLWRVQGLLAHRDPPPRP